MTPPPIPDWEVRLAGWLYLVLSVATIILMAWFVVAYSWWLVGEVRRRIRSHRGDDS